MMTPEAKKALSSTIRGKQGITGGGLRQRFLDDLRLATESAYRLSVRAQDAGVDDAAKTKRQRLDSWLDEQLRAQAAGGRRRQRDDFLREAEQQAAYTLLNRQVILRLLEEPGPSGQPLRKPAVIKGGWGSRLIRTSGIWHGVWCAMTPPRALASCCSSCLRSWRKTCPACLARQGSVI